MAAATSPSAAVGKQIPANPSIVAPTSSPPHDRFANVSPHTLPPSILRLLSLASPVINGLHDFIQLATWTGPSGGGTRSTLLLLLWTATCLFAYPLLRYAPQLIILAIILSSSIPNVLLPPSFTRKGRGAAKITPVPTFAVQTLTQAQTQRLLQKVSDILDVSSTLHTRLVLPTWQALTWQHSDGPGVTIGVAVLCISLGSFWTLCFADWPAAWGKVVRNLPLSRVYILGRQGITIVSDTGNILYNTKLKSHLSPEVDEWLLKGVSYVVRIRSRLSFNLLPDALRFTVFPPFPLFSLRLSHFTLTLGLISLSWCSTFATLVRYALWKSASVRWTVRAVLRVASAGYLGGQAHSDLSRYTLTNGDTRASSALQSKVKPANKAQVRTNIVHYRFDLHENQRWWVGLDWTAALLPQERASWTDSNLSPVSPPSSFTLPAEIVTTRQLEGGKWEQRSVKWSWDEDEWRVVIGEGGRMVLGDGTGDATPTTSATTSPRRNSGATVPASPTATPTLFSSFTRRASASSNSATSPSKVVAEGEELPPSNEFRSIQESISASTPSAFEDEDVEEETDISGWRYGDNSWEKMGPKSGLGKYTRRRRWVRRALMEERVEILDAAPTPAATLSPPDETNPSSSIESAPSQHGAEQVQGASLASSQSTRTESSNLDSSTSEGATSTSPAQAHPNGPSMSALGVGLGSPKVDFRTRLANAGKAPIPPPAGDSASARSGQEGGEK